MWISAVAQWQHAQLQIEGRSEVLSFILCPLLIVLVQFRNTPDMTKKVDWDVLASTQASK